MKTADPAAISALLAAADFASLKVIDELKNLLPPLTEDARKELRTGIEQDGIRDPLIVWKEESAIVDGFNRYEIAKELNIVPPVLQRSFPDIHAVKKFMLRNQLGRRNLTPDERTYFIGKLYAEVKEEKGDEKRSAAELGEQFGVSGRTVRRAAETAKGIDMIAKVKGAAAKVQELSGKGDYTKDELAHIGKASSATVAKRAVDAIDAQKTVQKAANVAKKTIQKAIKAAPTVYKAAFVKPDYGTLFNVTKEPKPNLDKDAMVFIVVPDEHLNDGFELAKHWGLTVEGQVIYMTEDKYMGVYTRIVHTSLFICTKGTVLGPEKGKERSSVLSAKDPIPDMIKLADDYARGGKRIDMRREGPAKGWDAVKA